MTSSTRQFRIQAIPTIFMVILVPLFSGLGIWQLDRAEQKRTQGVSLEMRRKLPALSLNDALPDSDELIFRDIVAEGHFLHDKTILIENRKHLGKAGYHIVTPLQLTTTSQIVLINRGWVAHDQMSETLLFDSAGIVTVHGEITIPQPPAIELELGKTATATTPRWPYLTLDHYRTWSGLDILPFIVLQSAEDESGFVRQWPHPRVSDMMHIGYAIQWFAFALITLLVWFRLSLHTPEETGATT
ncbi:MAG: SURF1 family protein [Candidatus Thiodiazotropha sp. (ex Codakia rugifera)]|nr:SURF1 family protein [Candidatus Thiodiazotropha sp. (ex Codakia rugifera)]